MLLLKELKISGFKSIRDQHIALGPLNVLIGANGAGKSNLLSFLDLLRAMADGQLQFQVAQQGGANALLHYGVKTTPHLAGGLAIQHDGQDGNYHLLLHHAVEDTLVCVSEVFPSTRHEASPDGSPIRKATAYRESKMFDAARGGTALDQDLYGLLRGIEVYHFHDTSDTASARQKCDIEDNGHLRHTASNLAAVLHRLQQSKLEYYLRIRDTIRQIAPFFDDFVLRPTAENESMIVLRWKERDRYLEFGPHQLSDGTLRAMALITLLLQPESDLPPLLVIDEPELGQHPYAIAALAGLIQAASLHCQVIVATQSPTLVDEFDPQDIIVAERRDGGTSFTRPAAEDLVEWLQDYSLGQLWIKNVVGGTP